MENKKKTRKVVNTTAKTKKTKRVIVAPGKRKILEQRQTDKKMKGLIIISLLFFAIIIIQILFVGITNTYRGIDLENYAQSRYLQEKSIEAERGSITDNKGNALAINIEEFKLVGVLNRDYKNIYGEPDFIEDPTLTANSLYPLLGVENNEDAKAFILEQFSKDPAEAFQVELGKYASNLTSEEKKKIEELDLPGIQFVESSLRYYPYGDFASYILGYVKKDDNGKVDGQMGIEEMLNGYLMGADGQYVEQQDFNNIALSDEQKQYIESTDGVDVELTIDSQIQTFIQSAMNETLKGQKFDQAMTVMMDAKTGQILGAYALPSFDPNIRDIENYIDPFVNYCYEPGSTMKAFTFASAMEEGVYDSKKTGKSGVRFKDSWGKGNSVGDWLYNDYDETWGNITWDEAFYFSSNTVTTMIQDQIGIEKYNDYITNKFKFGKSIDTEYMKTPACDYAPQYPLEYANTSFGQGLTVNIIQLMQAYSVFGNDGDMLLPHVVKELKDPVTQKVIYSSKDDANILNKDVVSSETATKILDLMYGVTHYNADKETFSRGTNVNFGKGEVELAGKSGTAQMVQNGEYASGSSIIYSFAGFAPYDDPEILLYSAVVNPESPLTISQTMSEYYVPIVDNTISYLKGADTSIAVDYDIDNRFYIEDYVKRDISEVKKELNDLGMNVVSLGKGAVNKQFPSSKQTISKNEIIYLKGDGTFNSNDFKGKTYTQAHGICSVLDWDCTYDGVGKIATVNKLNDTTYSFEMTSPAQATQFKSVQGIQKGLKPQVKDKK